MTTVLVLGAGGSAAANVIDALRRSGRDYRIVGADASPVKLHLSLADERVVVPRASDPPDTSTRSRARSNGGRATSCTRSPTPRSWPSAPRDNRLGARTYLPPQDVLELAGDKLRFAEQMRRRGRHGSRSPRPTSRKRASSTPPTRS